jgi:carbamoyl-phosphate synthase small subunit
VSAERSTRARLALEDGAAFAGTAFGGQRPAAGEVVFNTGMVGYPEALTDPSYRGQILVLTYPLVGNYGVPAFRVDADGLPAGFESSEIQVAGLVVSRLAPTYSHRDAALGLSDWLRAADVPGIADVDTRALTKRLRERGTMLGKIDLENAETAFADPNSTDLVGAVCPRRPARLGPAPGANGGAPRVVLMDCGCKASIARALVRRGFAVERVPPGHYFFEGDYDGLVVSNGPGDPRAVLPAVRNLERALAVGRPILGICLGHQLLALAAGFETYKMKFGHRGQNHPCVEHDIDAAGSPAQPGRRCYITSQNHGYAVHGEGAPSEWRVWFTNANDGTVEGIRHRSKPFFGVQFHPEARPGPTDTAWIFDAFADAVRKVRR